MKNKKGFTLVELLAVIAILAIMVIIALPNVLEMFNNAKKSSFETEIKNIYSAAEKEYINDSLSSSGNKTYAFCKNGNCGKGLKLDGGKDMEYYIEFDSGGKVTKYYATNGSYQYSYEGPGLKISDINNAEYVPDVSDDNIVRITKNGNVQEPRSFETDSWRTIIAAVRSNDTDVYNVGDEKSLTIDGFGTFRLRLANKSTPDSCSQDDFSQTSCGFIVEFKELLKSYKMNNTSTNEGGWGASEMRRYLNNDIYNMLPSDLKSGIIETKVVYATGTSGVNTSYDKIYIPSLTEIGSIYWETGRSQMRAMDYYVEHSSQGYRAKVNTYERGERWKSDYWSRTLANNDIVNSFKVVYRDGSFVINIPATSYYGVAPIFRIG